MLCLQPPGTLIKEGWLIKQGGVRKSWKRRWFRFTVGSLRYYEKPVESGRYETVKPKGEIPSYAISNVQTADGEVKQPYPFKLVTMGRVYILSAASPEERKEWLDVIWEHVGALQFPSMGRSGKGSVSIAAGPGAKLEAISAYTPSEQGYLALRKGAKYTLVDKPREGVWNVKSEDESELGWASPAMMKVLEPGDVRKSSAKKRKSSASKRQQRRRSSEEGSRGKRAESHPDGWHKPEHGILFTAFEGSVTRAHGSHTVWEPAVHKFIQSTPQKDPFESSDDGDGGDVGDGDDDNDNDNDNGSDNDA